MKTKAKRASKKTSKRGRKATPRRSLSKVRSILVPVDFSPFSERLLKHAAVMAREHGAKLTLLHVVEPIATPDFAAMTPMVREEERLLSAAESGLTELVRSAGIPEENVSALLVRFGRSYHEIVNAAAERDVDLLLIATHGHTGLKRALLGGTTERVVQLAPCPVLVVRE